MFSRPNRRFERTGHRLLGLHERFFIEFGSVTDTADDDRFRPAALFEPNCDRAPQLLRVASGSQLLGMLSYIRCGVLFPHSLRSVDPTCVACTACTVSL
jgi:hypothetical protein